MTKPTCSNGPFFFYAFLAHVAATAIIFDEPGTAWKEAAAHAVVMKLQLSQHSVHNLGADDDDG